jgi:glycine/D-amino acid oxidase-like deaminating enzyme
MGSRKRIVICGAGAIGAAIAYFIGRRGAQQIVIERHEVAGAASGSRAAFWRSTGAVAARSIDWRAVASNSMPNFPPGSAILGDIGG